MSTGLAASSTSSYSNRMLPYNNKYLLFVFTFDGIMQKSGPARCIVGPARPDGLPKIYGPPARAGH